jgi:hypothetical protein
METRSKNASDQSSKSVPGPRIDPDYAALALLYLSKHSQLPELYEILGAKTLQKLIENFGGQTIILPTRDQLKQALIHVSIYRKVNQGLKFEAIGNIFKMLTQEVVDIYYRTRDTFNEINKQQTILEADATEEDRISIEFLKKGGMP